MQSELLKTEGDYLLRAKVKTALEEQTIDVPLPLYAPAKIHVLTDRPLYEPGNDQQKAFLDDLIAKQAKAAIDFPPEVYVQDRTGVRELLSGTVVK